VRCVLSEDVELSLEMLHVKRTLLGLGTIPVIGAENDKRLIDGGFFAFRGRTEDRPVRRNLSPPKHAEAEIVSDFGERSLLELALFIVERVEEDISNCILPGVWEDAAQVSFGLTLEKCMRNARHHASAVAISTIRASGASVSHSAEELTGVGHNLVARNTFDLAYETYTASVAVVFIVVKALLRGK
jgi:hypothetical protein